MKVTVLKLVAAMMVMKANGMRLAGAGRGFRGGGSGQGQGYRWRQHQVDVNEMNGVPENEQGQWQGGYGRQGQGQGHGRRGQGRGGYGGGRGYGRRGWAQDQFAGDTSTATLTMDRTTTSTRAAGGRNRNDMDTIQNLVDHREHIQRQVQQTKEGIQTHTWSDKEQVSDWIIEHVKSMKQRMETGNRIRQRDPLFVAAFDRAHLIDEFDVEVMEDGVGVKVTETSTDPCTVDILHAHSDVVSGFIDHGRYELRRNHPVPDSCQDGSLEP